MASVVGSLRLVVDAKMDGALMLRAAPNFGRSRTGYYKPRTVVEEDDLSCRFSLMRVSKGSDRALDWRIRCLNDDDKKGAAGGQDAEDSEAVIQDTIEKSKKVLQMQRDLLQQVIFYYCLLLSLTH